MTNDSVKERYPMFRADGGRRLPFENQEFRELKAPFNGERIAMVGELNEKQAFENLATLLRTAKSRTQPKAYERAAILRKAAERVKSKHAFYSDLIAWEGGKPLRDAEVEVTRAINSLEIAAEAAISLHGEEIPMRGTKAASGRIAWTTLEPIGVVFAISAFNHPLNLIAHQVGPAIAAGCPVIIKPSSETPLSCFHLLDELYEAGLPPEMALPLQCSNEIAEKLASSPDIHFLSFIGSAKVGWHLKSVLAAGTRFALEHGGSAPAIVERTADLETAIPSLVKASYYHSGQVCVSTQRIYVHDSIYDDFSRRFVAAVRALKTGDARLRDTDCGPIIRARDLERIDAQVKGAMDRGAKLLTGGRRLGPSTYEPTVVTDVEPSDPLLQEEIFGPVVSLISYRTLDEAIDLANNVPWSFQAAIYTSEIEPALQAARRLSASAVMINESTAFRVDWMPFRGDGPSGFGTGGIPFSTRDMMKEKMIVIKSAAFDV